MRVGQVDLVQRDQPHAVLEAAASGELGLDHLEVVDRVAARFVGTEVDHVDDRLAALDVAQEVEAEATPLGGALDQAGHVGDGVGHVARHDDAEIRHERGERVVGDLRPCPRDRGHERGFPRRREADEADVRDDLQLQLDEAFLALLAEQREAWGLARGRREGRVAEAAATALGDDELVAWMGQVGEHLARLGVGDDRSRRDRKHDGLAARAVLEVALAWLAVGGLAHRLAVVLDERRQRVVDAQRDRPTLAAVAAVGAAERLELLAVDGGAAVPAVAGLDGQLDAVYEGGNSHSSVSLPGAIAGSGLEDHAQFLQLRSQVVGQLPAEAVAEVDETSIRLYLEPRLASRGIGQDEPHVTAPDLCGVVPIGYRLLPFLGERRLLLEPVAMAVTSPASRCPGGWTNELRVRQRVAEAVLSRS